MTPTKAPSKGKQKRTYVLTSEVLEQFELRVAPGKRGAFIAEAIQKQLEEQRLAEIRARIEEGLNDSENEALYLEVEREWAPLSDELWAQLPEEEWPEPAIVFPGGYAAYEAQYLKDHARKNQEEPTT